MILWVLASYALVHSIGGALDLRVRLAFGVEHHPLVYYAKTWLTGAVLVSLVLAGRAALHPPSLPRWQGLILLTFAVSALATTILLPEPTLSRHGLIQLGNLAMVMALSLIGAHAVGAAPVVNTRRLAGALVLGTLLTIPLMSFTALFFGIVEGNFTLLLPGVGGIRVYGHVLTAGIAACTGLLAVARGRRDTALATVALAALWTMVFWSGGRGALVALVTATAIGAIMAPALRRRLGHAVLACTAGGALSLLIMTPHNHFNLLGALRPALRGPVVGGDFSSLRADIWADAIELIAQRPLTGHGYMQGWVLIDWPTIKQVHLHNAPLELAVAVGLPLAVAVLLVCLAGWLRAAALVRTSPDALAPFLVVTALGVLGLVSGTYYHMEGLIPAALMSGALIAQARAQSSSRALSAPRGPDSDSQIIQAHGTPAARTDTLSEVPHAQD